MPLPFWTRVEGIIWLPEHALVRSAIEGTVTRIVSVPDESVVVGQPLVITDDPFLESHEKILQSNLAESKARYRMARSTSRVEAENLKLEIAHVRADLDQAHADLDKQTVRSSANGTFVLSRGDDLLGRHLKQGELIGYVGDRSDANVRVVISQTDIALVRQNTRNILVRFSANPVRPLQATIAREVPAADYRLPTKALGTEGGGKIRVDPLDPSGTTALEKVFHIELTLAEPLETAHFGERVQVRFDHGTQPLASQLYRFGRQTLLRHFGV